MECCLTPSWELLNWGAPDSVSSSHFVSFQVGGIVIYFLASLLRNFIWGCRKLSDPATLETKIVLLR